MSAMGGVVRSGVGRRRLQTAVLVLATLMAVASAVVAGTLLVVSNAPFDQAFARQRGAHLTVQIDPAKATAAQIAATTRLPGVTASAGPFPVTTFVARDHGHRLPTLTVAGRPEAGGALDRVTLVKGRWPARTGEIVVPADLPPGAFSIGSKLSDEGGTELTIVGQGRSAGRSADAWVVPEQVGALRPKGAPATEQMFYRFSASGTKAEMDAARAAVTAALPAGAVLGGQSHLDVKATATRETATFVPFLVAFGGLGLFMSVIIVSSVVSGAVGAGIRRIGILKALGFTPAQVVRAYIAQALIPASLGIALGVVLGNLMAIPLLSEVGDLYGSAGLSVSWQVDLGVPAAAVAVVVIAALVPALRAGRLRTAEAIAVGRAPSTGRGQRAHRALGRLPLPRSVTLGLATPFARPVRTLAMLGALVFGTLAATFALGLASTLNTVGQARSPEGRAAVVVHPVFDGRGEPRPPTAADEAKIRDTVRAQPGTASFYGKSRGTEVTVAGVLTAVSAEFYRGDPGAGAYEMISGRWFTGPGEAVVPSRFLETTGHRVGDTIAVTSEGETARLKIVGEAFDLSDDGLRIKADAASFTEPVSLDGFFVTLTDGTDVAAYVARLDPLLKPMGQEAVPGEGDRSSTIVILDSIAALLTLMLVAVAGLGVLNSVVLDTRERVHDLGVCKAIGMSPRQTVIMVLASVAGLGAVGGLVGVPAGMLLHGEVLPRMAEGAGVRLTPHMMDVYPAAKLLLLGLAGIAIALLGAAFPAAWAAGTRTATALRTE
ncbi:ABC transporter permease [Actinocorallia longicatena]|uniref:ABC transport system permease protein n=1 Tax=Actinocorallia longicatena TaxID=111803 RepID=A0ABP6PVQ7_9ACTN